MNEKLLHFGPDEALVGTLTLPGEGDAAARPLGFIFVNAGFVHRVGPHRLNVRAARYLARQGYPALRFDFSGLGDSRRIAGEQDREARQLDEVKAALSTVTAQTGVRRFALLGFCSGTDSCIAAAMADARVAGVVLVDPFTYPTWRTRVRHLLQRVRAQVSFAGMLNALARKLRRRRKTPGFVMRETPPRAEFERWFATLLSRKVHALVMFSGSFPAQYNYAGQFTDTHGTFGDSPFLCVEYLPDADHTFTELSLRQAFLARILRWAAELG